ncbi:unnamed protein product [Moneuplotes crassus]|uniref:Uncharacterized protein n=1 Tax=Euplotes crassus TaxID=5936 RepID=A0AAD2D855_EUPCR|nr:unnamed protein product [Moneuplotes crassus]
MEIDDITSESAEGDNEILAELKKEQEEEEQKDKKQEFKQHVREVGKEINQRIEKQHELYKKFLAEEEIVADKNVNILDEILESLKASLDIIMMMKKKEKERLIAIIYNCSLIIYEICLLLKKNNYPKKAAKYLNFNLYCLNNNLMLRQTVIWEKEDIESLSNVTLKPDKVPDFISNEGYLFWRIKNYTQLAKCYEDFGNLRGALAVCKNGVQTVLFFMKIEEQTPPLPEHTKDAITECARIMKTQVLKYQVQSGAITPTAWKKGVEQTFYSNKYHRSLCVVESLTVGDPDRFSPISQNLEGVEWKKEVLIYAIELVIKDIEVVKEALIQRDELKRAKKEKEQVLLNDPDVNVEELIERHREMQDQMIKDEDWKAASYNVPLDIHIQIITFCFECKYWDFFNNLLRSALIRLKFRRYEVPYISTIDVLMSSLKDAAVPESFEKVKSKDLNSANLKIELKKIRKRKDRERDEILNYNNPFDQEEQKKNESFDINPNFATEEELQEIKHIYVNLLLQRSKNPKNAIVNLDVIMVDENNDNRIPDDHYAVAVPIRQHEGIYEKYHTIPYILFRRTKDNLRDDEDLLNLITDVTVITGKSPDIQPPLGYTKIPVDLRQTPGELIEVVNLDYVFICYKTDKDINIYERDLMLVKKLYDLNISILQIGTPEYDSLPGPKKYLGLTYNMDLLMDLSRRIRDSLTGPIGRFYYSQRIDEMKELVNIIIFQYILPVRKKMVEFLELKVQKEFSNQFDDDIEELILKTKNIFKDIMTASFEQFFIHSGNYLIKNSIAICIYFCNLLEEEGEYKTAIKYLKLTLKTIIRERNERLKKKSSYCINPSSLLFLHTSANNEIYESKRIIDQHYKIWEDIILKTERNKKREELKEHILDEFELEQESYEITQLEEIRKKDLERLPLFYNGHNLQDHERHKYVSISTYSNKDDYLNDLHLEVLCCLYKCELKQGFKLAKFHEQTMKLLTVQGFHEPEDQQKQLNSTSNTKQMNRSIRSLRSTRSFKKMKKEFKEIQEVYKETGKVPLYSSLVFNYEKRILIENYKNPYQNSLFSMIMAIYKPEQFDQRSLLLDSFNTLIKLTESQDTKNRITDAQEDDQGISLETENLKDKIFENAVMYKAIDLLLNRDEKTLDQIYPLNHISMLRYIKKTEVPTAPLMVGYSSNTLTMIIPFFKPLIEDKTLRNINLLSLLCREIEGKEKVEIDDNEYDGLEDLYKSGQIATVSNLTANKVYKLTCAGYTEEEEQVNDIGEETGEIIPCLPLNVKVLTAHLATICFKLGHYQIAKKASEYLLTQYLEKNKLPYRQLDVTTSTLFTFRLNYSCINHATPTTVKSLINCFLILSDVSKIQKSQEKPAEDRLRENKLRKQTSGLKIINFLMLALELSIILKDFPVIKRLIYEIYDNLRPYLTFDRLPPLIFYCLLYCHQSITLLPKSCVDSPTRRIGSIIGYNLCKPYLVRMGQEKLPFMYLILDAQSKIDLRKWRIHSKMITKADPLTNEMRAKREEQLEMIKKGGDIFYLEDDEIIKEPEPYEALESYIAETEKEGKAYDEFLEIFNLIVQKESENEFQGYIKKVPTQTTFVEQRIRKYEEMLKSFTLQITGGKDIIPKMIKEMQIVTSFWKIMADDPKLIVNNIRFINHPNFLKFNCIALRRIAESQMVSLLDYRQLINHINMDEDIINTAQTWAFERKELLAKDIVRQRKKRILEKFGNTENGIEGFEQQKQLHQEIGQSKRSKEEFFQIDKQHFPYCSMVAELEFLRGSNETKILKQNYLYIKEFGESNSPMTLLIDLQEMVILAKNHREFLLNEKLRIRKEQRKYNIDSRSARSHDKDLIMREDDFQADEIIIVPIDPLTEDISIVLEIYCRAGQFAIVSQNWNQFDNILRGAWNLMAYHLSSPFGFERTTAYQDIYLLADQLIHYLNHFTDIKAPPTEEEEINIEKNFTPKFTNNEKLIIPDTPFDNLEGRDMRIYGNFIAFTVQCLFVSEKWESIIDLISRFTEAISMFPPIDPEFISFLKIYLFKYIVYSVDKLYQVACAKSKDKRDELKLRTQQLNTYSEKKSDSSKAINMERTAAQLLQNRRDATGGLLPDEIELKRDKGQLESELARLEAFENFLYLEKEQYEQSLKSMQDKYSPIKEQLRVNRLLYRKFSSETFNLEEKQRRQPEATVLKASFKAHEALSGLVISNYSNLIETAKSEKDNYAVIQCYNEIGNLYHSVGNEEEAAKNWKGAIQIFSEELKETEVYLAEKIGIQQCLLLGIISSKLSRICYSNKILNEGETYIGNGIDIYTSISTKCFIACFSLSLPHPQKLIDYRNYRMTEFIKKIEIIEDNQAFTYNELIFALEITCDVLIDHDAYTQVLPLLCLMEHISVDIIKSVPNMIKSRIMKSIALAELGYINESLQLVFKIIEEKDTPLDSSQKDSEYNKQLQGQFFQFTDKKYFFKNDQAPEEIGNKKVIVLLLNLEMKISEKYKVSAFLEQYFRYCRCIILQSILSKVPFRENETAEVHIMYSKIQNEILSLLGILDKEELVHDCIGKISMYYDVFNKGIDYFPETKGMTHKQEEYIKDLQSQLAKILSTNSEGQIILDDASKSVFLYHDEHKPLQYRRSERLALMLKSRMLLSKVYHNITLLKAYYILDQGLMNFHFYCIGRLNSEKCNLYQKKGFEIPSHLGSRIFEIHEKTLTKKDPQNPLISDEMLEIIQRTILQKKCSVPYAYIWVKAKYELIKILFLQERYDEVMIFCDNAKSECNDLGDTYYTRLLDQLLVICAFQRGYYKRGLEMFNDLQNYAEAHLHKDLELAIFKANIGEIIYHYDQDSMCIDLFKQSREIMSEYLHKIGYRTEKISDYPSDVNINTKDPKFMKPDVYNKRDRKYRHLKEELGKIQQRKTLEKPKFSDVLDFRKEIFYELFYEDKMDFLPALNNSIYLCNLGTLIKVELRYAHTLCIIKQKYEETLEILKYTERMIEDCVYPNPYNSYITNFLKGYCHKMIFYSKLGSFQSKILELSRTKINKVYSDFARDLPASGIATGAMFAAIPNYRKHIKHEWRRYLLDAEKFLLKAVEFTKTECILGEFDIDMSDSVFNLSEVYFLLFEYAEDRIDFMFIDYPNLCVNVPPEKRHEGPLEDCNCEFCRSKIPFSKSIAETQLESYNYHLKAMEYSLYGRKMLRAKNILLDGNFNTGNISTIQLRDIPDDILYELFETQKFHQIKFMSSLPEEMDPEEKITYNFSQAKIHENNPDVIISEKDSIYNSYCETYLCLILSELRYFTFGAERKSKNISVLHSILSKHENSEAAISYSQDCRVAFPQPELVNLLANV